MQLFKSGHFALTEIRAGGKKNIAGTLCFEGLPSVFGSSREIMALEDGVVLAAGRCVKRGSRMSRTGTYICVSGRNGVHLTYGRLDSRFVNAGDYVKAGDVIGLEGSSGSGNGNYLTLEFRRNGRRVDGCDYLGIARKTCVFEPPAGSPADIVTRAFKLDETMRAHLDSAPFADELWTRLLSRLTSPDEAASARS